MLSGCTQSAWLSDTILKEEGQTQAYMPDGILLYQCSAQQIPGEWLTKYFWLDALIAIKRGTVTGKKDRNADGPGVYERVVGIADFLDFV